MIRYNLSNPNLKTNLSNQNKFSILPVNATKTTLTFNNVYIPSKDYLSLDIAATKYIPSIYLNNDPPTVNIEINLSVTPINPLGQFSAYDKLFTATLHSIRSNYPTKTIKQIQDPVTIYLQDNLKIIKNDSYIKINNKFPVNCYLNGTLTYY